MHAYIRTNAILTGVLQTACYGAYHELATVVVLSASQSAEVTSRRAA